MTDQRLQKLASVLVGYSVSVKKGDVVRIAGDAIARPLIVELCGEVIRAGGHPVVRMMSAECEELLLRNGSDEQLEFEDPFLLNEYETVDATVAMWASENTKALSGIDPQRQALRSESKKRATRRLLQRAADGEARWVGTQFPCHASAQDAEMSLREYEDFVFRAGLLHLDDPPAAWRQISQRQQKLVDHLNGKSEVHFRTPQGTDLRLSVAERIWINCDGKENFPDGEVFTTPIEDSTNGVVRYSFPAVHGGREAHDIRLEFRDGRVVDASASKGEEFLIAMLDQDEGARVLGEIAIGTNYSINQYTKNTLFDEKIGGTFHAAVGACYPETGGKNQSGLHWDMVCDLRQGGEILVDGERLSYDGRFVDPSFPAP